MADGGGRKREAARVSTVDAGKAERERGEGGGERERERREVGRRECKKIKRTLTRGTRVLVVSIEDVCRV